MAWFYVKLDRYLFYLFGVVILLHGIFFRSVSYVRLLPLI